MGKQNELMNIRNDLVVKLEHANKTITELKHRISVIEFQRNNVESTANFVLGTIFKERFLDEYDIKHKILEYWVKEEGIAELLAIIQDFETDNQEIEDFAINSYDLIKREEIRIEAFELRMNDCDECINDFEAN